MSGYSTTTLFNKLGLKEGFTVKLPGAPAHYATLLGADYNRLHIDNDAVADLDLIHFFTNEKSALEKQLPVFMQQIKKNGSIWVSWYKKAAKKPTELTDEIVRNIALAAGLVDVKVCAVDEDWSGLKLVFRLKDRG